LEGHVGAQYLLPLLSGGEGRGLPGVVISRVAFQQAALGHPMDDVVVLGRDGQGRPATLELQAKRTINFTSSDKNFGDVMAFACRAMAKPDFASTRYELAVAISRTSTRIEQHVQDVLRWARDYQDAGSFFRRLNLPGTTHQEKRDFVAALRGHMQAAGALHDDISVWRLLSRFQVLAFDFEQPGSVCAQWARDRCALALATHDQGRAGEFLEALQQIALQVDASGGNLDAASLRHRLTGERGFRLAGDRRLHAARERIAETSRSALDDIDTQVHGIALDRSVYIAQALSALEQGRYLEIRGAGGVGKSAILKELAARVGIESRVMVVAPYRVPPGGWSAMQAQLGCDAAARDLLGDLAADGGGTLFIDGLDRIDDLGQQRTVIDLIRAAAEVPGFRVVATVRPEFDADARAWLPVTAMGTLGHASTLMVEELDDEEVEHLREANGVLAALLRPNHPAGKLVRNLYRLNRLARALPADATAASEAQMAWQWWSTGDSPDVPGQVARRRVLHALAKHSLTMSSPMDASTSPDEAIAALASSGSLRMLTTALIEPAHDVLRDWAVGCLLFEDTAAIDTLPLMLPAPARLIRGVEIAACLHVERERNEAAWRSFVDRVSPAGAHGSWRRAALLALARSERAGDLLNRTLPALAHNAAGLLSELVRAAITTDSQPAAPLWAALGLDTKFLTEDFVMPRGPSWGNLVSWSLAAGDRLPPAAVPQFVDLYRRWSMAFGGVDPVSPRLVDQLYGWLAVAESRNHRHSASMEEYIANKEAAGISLNTAQEEDLRVAFLAFCRLRPALAESYLRAMATRRHRRGPFSHLLQFVGTLPTAAPRALADLFLDVLVEGDSEEEDRRSGLRQDFSNWDRDYFPASPTRPPFLALLQADKEQGLRLVHGIVAHVLRRRSNGQNPGENRITIPFATGRRTFPWVQSYMMSRSWDTNIVPSALMALEAWAHLRIEAGEAVQGVIDDVLGPEGSPAAYLLVAVDVMLSHWPASRECLAPFAASAELLALDRDRFGQDCVSPQVSASWVRPEPAGPIQLENLQRRPSRSTPLDAVLLDFGAYGPATTREAMHAALLEDVTRLGPPSADCRGFADPRAAAMSAMNRLELKNYVHEPNSDGRPSITYVPPPDEAQLFGTLQAEAARDNEETSLHAELTSALGRSPCPTDLIDRGIRWGMREATAAPVAQAGVDLAWSERSKLIVAVLVLREGSAAQKAEAGDWARALLMEAAARAPAEEAFPQPFPHNETAIVAAGLLVICRAADDRATLERLLHLATRRSSGMSTVLGAELHAGRSVRPEVLRSLVRLGLASAIYALAPPFDDDFIGEGSMADRHQAREAERKEADRSKLLDLVSMELAWLTEQGPEPDWPQLPDPRQPRRRRLLLVTEAEDSEVPRPEQQREFAFSSGAGAPWLALAKDLWRTTEPALLQGMVRHCWQWTAAANGVGAKPDDEPGEEPYEWNDAYFAAALTAAVSTEPAALDELVYQPLAQLPEERFLDALEPTLHAVDQLWLAIRVLPDAAALSLRTVLMPRLTATRAWRRLEGDPSVGIEMQLGGAVAAMFMGQHLIGQGPRCYVPVGEAARAYQLMPLLTPLVEQAGGSLFVAMAFLRLLDLDPHLDRLEALSRAVNAWWNAQGANNAFWIDHGVGRRVYQWIDAAIGAGPVPRSVLDGPELTGILDVLTRCGTPLVKALEDRVEAIRSSLP